MKRLVLLVCLLTAIPLTARADVPDAAATVAADLNTSPTFDASVPGPLSSGEPVAQPPAPSATKDPVGFFKLAYGYTKTAQFALLFVLLLAGLVEVVRRPAVLKLIPWLKTPIGAHLSSGLVAFSLALTTGVMGSHNKLSASVVVIALGQALGAVLGWKVISAGGEPELVANPAGDPKPGA